MDHLFTLGMSSVGVAAVTLVARICGLEFRTCLRGLAIVCSTCDVVRAFM